LPSIHSRHRTSAGRSSSSRSNRRSLATLVLSLRRDDLYTADPAIVTTQKSGRRSGRTVRAPPRNFPDARTAGWPRSATVLSPARTPARRRRQQSADHRLSALGSHLRRHCQQSCGPTIDLDGGPQRSLDAVDQRQPVRFRITRLSGPDATAPPMVRNAGPKRSGSSSDTAFGQFSLSASTTSARPRPNASASGRTAEIALSGPPLRRVLLARTYLQNRPCRGSAQGCRPTLSPAARPAPKRRVGSSCRIGAPAFVWPKTACRPAQDRRLLS